MYLEIHSLIITSWFLDSVCLHPKVIPISGFHCICFLTTTTLKVSKKESKTKKKFVRLSDQPFEARQELRGGAGQVLRQLSPDHARSPKRIGKVGSSCYVVNNLSIIVISNYTFLTFNVVQRYFQNKIY